MNAKPAESEKMLPALPLADVASESYSYHEDYTRKSATMIKWYADSRREYEAIVVNRKKKPPESKPHMDLGSVVHSVFLEDADVKNFVLEAPDFALNKDGGWIGQHRELVLDVARRFGRGEPMNDIVHPYPSHILTTPGRNVSPTKSEKYRRDHPGKHHFMHPDYAAELIEAIGDRRSIEYVMKREDIENALRVVDRVRDETDLIKWLTHPDVQKEQSIFWNHQVMEHDENGRPTGKIIGEMPSRCKPDFLIVVQDLTLFVDLKVTINYTPRDFRLYLSGRGRGSQRGWIQLAHYTDGLVEKYGNRTVLRFAAVSPDFPHQLCINRVDAVTFENAYERYQKMMFDLFVSEQTGNYAETYEGDDNVVILSQDDLC